MKAKEIIKRQNEDKQLKRQFAARTEYNLAETWIAISWIVVILLAAIGLLGVSSDVQYPVQIGLVVVDAIAMTIAKRHIKNGAKIRAAFDKYVLGVSDEFDDEHISSIDEMVEKTILRHRKKYMTLKNNNGTDNPQGVKDWYIIPEEVLSADEEATFICQEENVWWDKKEFNAKLYILIALGFVTIIVALLLLKYSNNMLKTTAGLVPFFAYLIKRVCNNIKYRDASIALDTLVNDHKNKDYWVSVKVIQQGIDKRRALNVTHFNWWHKLTSKRYHTLYETHCGK